MALLVNKLSTPTTQLTHLVGPTTTTCTLLSLVTYYSSARAGVTAYTLIRVIAAREYGVDA